MTKHFSPRELAELLGVSTDTLRHYERKGVLSPPRRGPNGYRQYATESLERLQLVRRAMAVGFTLDELARFLKEKDRGGSPCAAVRQLASMKLAEVDERISELKTLRKELKETLNDWDVRLAHRRNGERANLLDHLPVRSTKAHENSRLVKKRKKEGK
ncbi:MAG TPA: heavy metal-responsive transcriptional regulator [Pyrinomonadaceae bacterium]|nr:heavy metal-responsive transcriptional regulator [Pyrinomonadaceae bacterium]